MCVSTATVMKHVEIVYTRGLNQSTPNIRKHKLSDAVFSLATSLRAKKASMFFYLKMPLMLLLSVHNTFFPVFLQS